jgi:hypothetical protein
MDDFRQGGAVRRHAAPAQRSVPGIGWWVDDIRVHSGSSCPSIADVLFTHGFEP